MNEAPKFSPTDFIEIANQTLEYSYGSILIEGEVASFKVNQGKWVFFDLKDENSSLSCFMTVYQLRIPIEDGMKVLVRCTPKITKWGKFSLTVQTLQPVGDGNLKRAYEILKQKLEKEGLFDSARKRKLPEYLDRIGVISSTGAAGYADFVKIINARWSGMKISVAHTQVQGLDAPDQMIRALNYFNEKNEVQVVVIIRGGGSADDLACFNDEKLARAIAASRIPVLTGIGHEVDESLADLAADVRASTPSNAAELLTHNKINEVRRIHKNIQQIGQVITQEIQKNRTLNKTKIKRVLDSVILKYIDPVMKDNYEKVKKCKEKIEMHFESIHKEFEQKLKLLEANNPENVLKKGYAIITGNLAIGSEINVETFKKKIKADIKSIKEKE